jgi:hypothetical protein
MLSARSVKEANIVATGEKRIGRRLSNEPGAVAHGTKAIL